MPSHAEKNQTEIKNYYRIIDPEERLSENEKAEEERKVLANMPACFPAALRYVMTRFGFTQEALAFESKVSESTIGRYRNGKVKSFSEKNVVALCVAMHLPPWLSFALIAKAGFSLAATREQQAYEAIGPQNGLVASFLEIFSEARAQKVSPKWRQNGTIRRCETV